MNLQDLMMHYGVTLGNRRSRKNKYLFAQYIGECYPQFGFPVVVQQEKTALGHVENIIAGDLAQADVVFIAGFDTPAKTLYPCQYFPFHPELTLRHRRRELVLEIFIALSLFMAAFMLTWLARGAVLVTWLGYLLAFVCTVLGLSRFFPGANRFNFNYHSASLAVMECLAGECSGNKKIAFAFCDCCVDSYNGYKQLARKLSPDCTPIILDCVADGEKLVVADGERRVVPDGERRVAPEGEKPVATDGKRPVMPDGERSSVYNGKIAGQCIHELIDQMNTLNFCIVYRSYTMEEIGRNILSIFPKGIIITSGSIENGELVVRNIGTKRDIVLNLPRMNALSQSLIQCTFKCIN